MFGNAFYREHGKSPSDLWHQSVAKLTDAQIARGLANLGNDDLRFPANLSMFVSACNREPENPGPRLLGVEYPALTHDEQAANAEKAWRDMEKLAGRKLRPQ